MAPSITTLRGILILAVVFPSTLEGTHWLTGGGRQECPQTICTCNGTINGIEVLRRNPPSHETNPESTSNTTDSTQHCKTYSLGECKFSVLDDHITRIHLVTNNITDIINLRDERVGYAPQVEIVGTRRGVKYYNTILGDLIDTKEKIRPEPLKELAVDICPSSLSELTSDTFAPFTSLTILKLKSSDCFLVLGSPGFLAKQGWLKGLHIHHVKINNIHKGDFCHLQQLDYVAITYMGPSVIQGFQCKDTVCNGHCLSQLEHLQLRGNNISNIDIMLAQVMPNVEEIDLSENVIVTIEENIYYNLTRLQRLSFKNNRITHVALNSFKNLLKLSELDLSFNNLHTIDMDVFEIIFDLKLLNLSHNFLNEIDNKGIPENLETLSVRNNPLRSVGEKTFLTRKRALKLLDLSNTDLHNLQIRNISYCIQDVDVSEVCKPDALMHVYLDGNR